MDKQKIYLLLEKYYAGDTSLEEEQDLRALMLKEDLPDDLRQQAALFQYFQQEKTSRKYDAAMPIFNGKAKKATVKPLRNWVLGIAASILILIGFGTVVYQFQNAPLQQESQQDTYDDPNMAYEEAKKALLLVSTKLNSGKKYQLHIDKLKHLNTHETDE